MINKNPHINNIRFKPKAVMRIEKYFLGIKHSIIIVIETTIWESAKVKTQISKINACGQHLDTLKSKFNEAIANKPNKIVAMLKICFLAFICTLDTSL
jgi:hypothetical protein